jgi:capsid portal protein
MSKSDERFRFQAIKMDRIFRVGAQMISSKAVWYALYGKRNENPRYLEIS